MAGYVDLSTCDNEVNANKYFINDINTEWTQNYLYNILLYYQDYFIKCANNNNTICLAKKFIESCMIPKINLELQKKINNDINELNINICEYEKLISRPVIFFFN